MNILFINEYQVNEFEGGVQRVTKILNDYFISLGFSVFSVYKISSKNTKFCYLNDFIFPSTIIYSPDNIDFINSVVLKYGINIIINQMGFSKDVIRLIRNSNHQIPIFSCLHSTPLFQLYSAANELNLNKFNLKSPALFFKFITKPIYLFFLKEKIKKNLYFVYNNSDYTIILSKYFMEPFLNLLKINSNSKLIVLENPLDNSFRLTNPKFVQKGKSILYVGRLNQDKRVVLLLDIWEKFYFQFPNWYFDIVGDGPEINFLKNYVLNKKLVNVRFHGNCLDVISFYDNASILVSASSYEGFPMVLIEALSKGVIPIVFNSYESVNEILTNDFNGIIVEDLDKTKFLDSLVYLVLNTHIREKFFFNCLLSSKRFYVENVGPKWLSLFRGVIR